MSERQVIEQKIGQLQRRRRWQLVLEGAVAGLFWGAIAVGLLTFASKLWILPLGSLALGTLSGERVLACALLLTGISAGAGTGLLKKTSRLGIANEIDLRLGLRERVSSALALDDKSARQPFVRMLIKDAATALKDLPLGSIFPWALPGRWRHALLALAVAAGLSFVPQLNWFTKSSDRAEARLVQESGKNVLELAKQVEKEAEKQKDPELRKLGQEIKRVGEKLNNQQLRKKEALKELQRLKDKLETQSRNQSPAGQKALEGELAEQLKQMASTRELGELLDKGGLKQMTAQFGQLMKELAEGKVGDKQLDQLQDMSKAIKEALKSKAADDPGAQALKKQLEQLDKAIQDAQQAQKQLQQALDKFQQDLNQATQTMQQNKLGQQAQELQQLSQQLSQQMQNQGSLDPQTLEQLQQGLEQSMQQAQQMQQSGQLSQSQAQQVMQQAQQAMEHLQGQDGQQGELSQSNGQSQNANGKLGEGMQGMTGQQGGGMGEMLAQQIAEMKQQMGYGQLGSQGQAASGWGTGVSPYAVSPAPAKGQQQVEDRDKRGEDYGERSPVDYEALYEGQDMGHAFSKEGQLKGKIDLTKAPQRIDEVRSAPETQEALQQYAQILAAAGDGKETAVALEEIPAEYRELVKQYFDQLQRESKSP